MEFFTRKPLFRPLEKTSTPQQEKEKLLNAYHDWILRIGIYRPKKRPLLNRISAWKVGLQEEPYRNPKPLFKPEQKA